MGFRPQACSPTPIWGSLRTDEVSITDAEPGTAPSLQVLQHRLLERQGGHAAEEGLHVLPCGPVK